MWTMEQKVLQKFVVSEPAAAEEILKQFCKTHAQTFTFSNFDRPTKEAIIGKIYSLLCSQQSSKCLTTCLETLRILSRDKTDLDLLTSKDMIHQLLVLSGIEGYANSDTFQPPENTVIVEAQKCLCNVIYNSKAAQRHCSQKNCVEGIVQRLKTYKDPDLIYEIKYFDMKLMFLITALCADVRPKLRFELHAFSYLYEVLDLCLKDADERKRLLLDKDVDLCCEVLKVLFNLTVSVEKTAKIDEEEEAHLMRLVSVLRDLLVVGTKTKEKRFELQSHIVNLLTNMPRDCYEELLTPMNECEEAMTMNPNSVEYDGKNMEAIVILLDFLDRRLDSPQKTMKENVTAILHAMAECCRGNRYIRKFTRIRILPPLKGEVKQLPEEGKTIRNKLCRLLTNPVREVKELSAELLFVLCKENVNRLVKYTGFGNSAGLLASRGLMGGGRSPGQDDYSSESDDSDTEEYQELQEKVNPVTGRYEEEKPDPLEGMSEEQKEYEALQLVNIMDKLCRDGAVKPCRVGPDGKPRPAEHILQFLEDTEPMEGAQEASTLDEED